MLKDKVTNEFLSDLIRIEFLEINKALNAISTKDMIQEFNRRTLTEIEQWTIFIGSRDREVLEMVATQNPAIQKAYSRLQRVSDDDKKRAEAISREKAILDWNSSIDGSYQAGKADGKKEGLKEGHSKAVASVIRRMKSKEYSRDKIIEEIMDLFGLTYDEAFEAIRVTL